MKKTKLIFFLILFISCNKKYKFEKNLINLNKSDFWIVKNHVTNSSKLDTIVVDNHLQFYKDGTFQKFFFHKKNLQTPNDIDLGVVLNSIHGITSYKWSYNPEDSTLNTGFPRIYQVLRYNTDTIFLVNVINQPQYLIRSKRMKNN
jgi:hypothetical protein